MSKYIHEYSLKRMCQVFGINRSGYYKWKVSGDSKRSLENKKILEEIKNIYYDSRCLYGSPRIHAILKRRGIFCSCRRTAKLMKLNGLMSKIRKVYKVTTNSKHSYFVSPNLLGQEFKVTSPDKVWVSDITYIPTGTGWLYLTTIIDLFNREVIGHWKSKSLKTSDTVVMAFREACLRRKPQAGLLFHSDRGSQYASHEFRSLLGKYNIRQSMSGKGNCYDNAVAESFFKTLKSELIYKESKYKTFEEAKRSIFEYIECYYNAKRSHSSIDYYTPREWIQKYYKEAEKCA